MLHNTDHVRENQGISSSYLKTLVADLPLSVLHPTQEMSKTTAL